MNRKERRSFRFFRADKNGLRNEAVAYKNLCLKSKCPITRQFAKDTQIYELHCYSRQGIAKLRASFKQMAIDGDKRHKERKNK
jgi:hypothetical protein